MIEHQTDQPLYPKVLWNRPISRATAGRLLIVGGHQHNVSLLQNTFQMAEACGIGQISLLVPDALRKLLGAIPEIDFGPSTASGSLAKLALGQLEELSSHADATLIGPNLSNNSETAITIEKFIEKYHQPLIITEDALEVVANTPDLIRSRPKTLIILSMQQLFKLAGKLQLPIHIKPEAGVQGKVDIVRDLFDTLKVDLGLIGPELIIMTEERTSVTALSHQPKDLLAATNGTLSVFYTQNPTKAYEALTTAAFVISQAITEADNSLSQLASSIHSAITSIEQT